MTFLFCFFLQVSFLKGFLSAQLVSPYADQLLLGDKFFQKKEYFFAFETYRKALKYNNKNASLHYRLGRIYGLLEPKKPLCEREYGIAMTLLFNEVDHNTKLLNRDVFREILGIPIDQSLDDEGDSMNPCLFVKRDIDSDGKQEIFVLLRRGRYFYSLFIIDFFDEHLRVQHLLTFFEKPLYKNCLQFIDVNGDHREEIIVRTHTNSLTNFFVFEKTWGGSYRKNFDATGLFDSTQIFCDLTGDDSLELEIHEKIPHKTVFSNKKFFLTQRSVYQSKRHAYRLIDRRLIHDEYYVLNAFFRSLLFENDFETAFHFVDQDKFLGSLFFQSGIEGFKKFMRRKDYRVFLAETGFFHNPRKQIKIVEDKRYEPFLGWQEGGVPSLNLKRGELHCNMIVGRQLYSIVLKRKAVWKIHKLLLHNFQNGGWQ